MAGAIETCDYGSGEIEDCKPLEGPFVSCDVVMWSPRHEVRVAGTWTEKGIARPRQYENMVLGVVDDGRRCSAPFFKYWPFSVQRSTMSVEPHCHDAVFASFERDCGKGVLVFHER
jgi:hypothetical protein